MVTLVLLPQDSAELALSVLHLVPLVDHNVLPVLLIQTQPILQNEIVSSDTNVPLCRLHDPAGLSTRCRVALIHDFSDRGSPFLKLSHPVGNRRKRCNDQEGAKVLN